MERSVRVWVIRPDLVSDRLAALADVLDEAEREHAASLRHARDRDRYVACHAAARVIVAGHLGISPATVQWRRTRHGKPEVVGADIRTNLSHSDELALFAVTASVPVGVDVQRVYHHVDPVRMARRYYPVAEAEYVAAAGPDGPDRFAVLWCRKEACLKAAGGRLMEGLRLPVQDSGDVHDVLVRDADGPLPGPFRVRDLDMPEDFRAAVALAGEDPFTVTVEAWP